MRIRILKDTKATFITTTNDSGAMNVETKEKEIRQGQVISGVESISPNSDETTDIHLLGGSVITDIPTKSMEQHGDFPVGGVANSKTCCKPH
ncbi:uncharacterized protein METZ01_LOCUS252751 [marine metagenome]|jgi:hypothetical protein|uniref:Uncharacterized protein n=1 Tax=marine metagenome TaxID=408172 RepID=A0A382IKZ7_9ZZZZ